MTVFLTGDTHGIHDTDKIKYIAENNIIKQGDTLIILGDFGVPWNAYILKHDEIKWINWIEKQPFQILFIDGNHENFDFLKTLDSIPFKGGMAQKLSQNLYHLNRGEIFEIEGMSFFTMGGAMSIDKALRSEHISWWKEEIPNDTERAHAIETLASHNYTVDYVLTHCPPTSELIRLTTYLGQDTFTDEYAQWLQTDIYAPTTFTKWFYGHMHVDTEFDNFCALYNAVYNLSNNEWVHY